MRANTVAAHKKEGLRAEDPCAIGRAATARDVVVQEGSIA
jgi:hypothetical protein